MPNFVLLRVSSWNLEATLEGRHIRKITKGGGFMEVFLEILKYVSGTIIAISPIVVMYTKRKNAHKKRSKTHRRKG